MALAHADARDLTRDGVHVRPVLAILGGVVYLLHRARRTGSKPILPGIWLASAGVWAVGVAGLAPQDASFDRADVAARIERWVS